MSINLDKTELNNDTLIITNDDGTVQCIPKADCTVDEQAMFDEFIAAYPDGKPVIIDIDALKQSKTDEISAACGVAIISGFTSTAYQGILKTYKSTLEDQTNITGNAFSAMSKLNGTPGCENDKFYYHAQDEEFVEWEAADCLSLARDMKSFKEVQLFKSATLQAYVMTLTVAADIIAISWDMVLPS